MKYEKNKFQSFNPIGSSIGNLYYKLKNGYMYKIEHIFVFNNVDYCEPNKNSHSGYNCIVFQVNNEVLKGYYLKPNFIGSDLYKCKNLKRLYVLKPAKKGFLALFKDHKGNVVTSNVHETEESLKKSLSLNFDDYEIKEIEYYL